MQRRMSHSPQRLALTTYLRTCTVPVRRLAFSWNGRMGAASHGCCAATASFTSSVLLVLCISESVNMRFNKCFCSRLDMTCGGMRIFCTAKTSSRTLLDFAMHSSAVRADLRAAIAHDAEAAATLTV